jgi:protocatechuate 3,4-dioxygenase beta subunit
MKQVCYYGFFLLLLNVISACNAQTGSNARRATSGSSAIVGGGCDGCELMYVGMPAVMDAVDTSAGWFEQGQKLLVTGTVYKIDGKTPAPGVIIYYWQTDNKGHYSPGKANLGEAKRHGHIRGWVKSGTDGQYSIYTIRPAPYPNADMPAHIHTSIKEPNIGNEYYIDEFVFDDDRLLTGAKRKEAQNRGGSGVLRVLISGELQVAEHDIILGLNVPNYPETAKAAKSSGLQIGEDAPSFMPTHAWGPDKGTRTCPVCKYGRYHGIVFFVGDHPDWNDIKKWLTFLERESINRKQYLKAFFVYGSQINYSREGRQRELERLGAELNLNQIALTFVPSMNDVESEANLYKINPAVKNTIIVYRHRTIVDKFIELAATAESFVLVSNVLDKTRGNYFSLPEPAH